MPISKIFINEYTRLKMDIMTVGWLLPTKVSPKKIRVSRTGSYYSYSI